MSYRKSHVKNKIGKIKPKKSIFKKLWFWVLFLILVVILTAGYFALFYSGFQIKNIIISGNEKISSQDLQKLALESANTGLIKFWTINITSKSIFLFDQNNLYKEILKDFPIIEKVNINIEYPQTVSVEITERKSIADYCDNNGNCFLIDNNGIVFQPTTIADKSFIVRQALDDKQAFAGEQVINENIINSISKIEKSLKDNFQIDLKEALVTSPIRLNIKTSEGWQIYFDLSPDSDINSQITKLDLLLKDEIAKDSRKKLFYIDLRPKDRAIICDNSTCGG